VIGIQEYLALEHRCKKYDINTGDAYCGRESLMLFQGLPVVIKSSPGVELALDIDAAIQFSEIRKSKVNNYMREGLA